MKLSASKHPKKRAMARTWLTKLCDPGRPKIERPFRVTLSGTEYDCATNGHAALLVRGGTLKNPADKSIAKAIGELLSPGRAWRSGSIAADRLRSWAAVHGDRSGVHQVRVLGVCLNGNLLGRYLPAQLSLEGNVKVSACGRLDVVRFDGDGWRLFVMPMAVQELEVDESKPANHRKKSGGRK